MKDFLDLCTTNPVVENYNLSSAKFATSHNRLNSIAHEYKHRMQGGNSLYSMVCMGASYAYHSLSLMYLGMNKDIAYKLNPFEIEAYSYGVVTKGYSFKPETQLMVAANPEIVKILVDENICTEEKSLLMAKYGLEYRINKYKEYIQEMEDFSRDSEYSEQVVKFLKPYYKRVDELEIILEKINSLIEIFTEKKNRDKPAEDTPKSSSKF